MYPSSRHMHFPERNNDCKGRLCLSVWLQALILTLKWHHLRKAMCCFVHVFFFPDRCLGLKCCSDSRCFSRFSAHMQEQKGECPVFPQYGNCYSCRDPPFFATSLNSYFLSRNHSHVQDNTRCINLPSVSSRFRHSLHTSQKTYLAFYYFHLMTINPSFLPWRSQQDFLSLLVPSAAIKRCRVSECDQLLHRGPATVLENIQGSETS